MAWFVWIPFWNESIEKTLKPLNLGWRMWASRWWQDGTAKTSQSSDSRSWWHTNQVGLRSWSWLNGRHCLRTLWVAGIVISSWSRAQAVRSGRFCKFDYGKTQNKEIYGSEEPPDYDLSKLRVPTALFLGMMILGICAWEWPVSILFHRRNR